MPEIHRVFDALDTDLVGMCLDTGHALFGGADPLELLEAYGDCVRLVHIKDCDRDVLGRVCQSGGGLMEAWDRGVFCELGLVRPASIRSSRRSRRAATTDG